MKGLSGGTLLPVSKTPVSYVDFISAVLVDVVTMAIVEWLDSEAASYQSAQDIKGLSTRNFVISVMAVISCTIPHW